MGEVKTGALIVVEQNIILQEYEKTGIAMDSLISSQLLINIFEHNTPLHDGAVIVRNNRIVSATCYLPLSDNLELNKSLGTRHRAGVGISEVSDALTIIVSEETGKVSYTYGGKIVIGVTPDLYRRRQRNRIRTCGHLHGKPQPGIELWYEICRCVSGELEKNKNRECRIRETYLHSLFSLTGDCFPVHNPASDCIECR